MILVETGLRFCCPEKKDQNPTCCVWQSGFSGPVLGCESRNARNFWRLSKPYWGSCLQSRLADGGRGIRTLGTVHGWATCAASDSYTAYLEWREMGRRI